MQIRNANVDARAPYRDRHAPEKLTVKSVKADSPLALISDAINASPMAAVIVTSSGKIWQMTAGGSGVIWVQGSGRFNAAQRDALDDITAAFEAEWPHLAQPKNLTGTVSPSRDQLDDMLGVTEPVKKRKPRKKAANPPPVPPFTVAD